MDISNILHLLSTMGYAYEIQSDNPGITFNNGFKSYGKLLKPSEMFMQLDNGDYADRHSCRSVTGGNNGQ